MHDDDQVSDEELSGLAPAVARERLLRRSRPGDSLPAEITIGQLLRVQQVVSQTLESGVEAMREQLAAADMFLISVLTSSGDLRGHSNVDPAQRWLDLDRLRIVPANVDGRRAGPANH